jgi:hypothetical protein
VLLLFGIAGALFSLVLKLAKIHQLDNGWARIQANHNQIKPQLLGKGFGFGTVDDATATFFNQPKLGGTNAGVKDLRPFVIRFACGLLLLVW